MTLLQLEILIHYGYSPRDYRDGDYSASAVREAINAFRGQLGLLEPVPDVDKLRDSERCYRLTERGERFLTALKETELPVLTQVWIMPPAKREHSRAWHEGFQAFTGNPMMTQHGNPYTNKHSKCYIEWQAGFMAAGEAHSRVP